MNHFWQRAIFISWLICVSKRPNRNQSVVSILTLWSHLTYQPFKAACERKFASFSVMADKFPPQHRFLLAAWYEVYQCPVVVQRFHRRRFGRNASVPSAASIKAIHRRASVDGTLADKPRSGRPVTTSKPVTVQLVMDIFSAHPTISTRLASRQLNLSKSTVQRKTSNYYSC